MRVLSLGAIVVVASVSACQWPVDNATQSCLSSLALADDFVGFTACTPAVDPSETPQLLVALVNHSRQPVLVRGRLDLEDGLNVFLRDEAGGTEVIPRDGYLWEQVDIPSLEEVVLTSGSMLVRIIDLGCAIPDYGVEADDDVCVSISDLLAPGAYELEIRYEGWICRASPCSLGSTIPGVPYSSQVRLVVPG